MNEPKFVSLRHILVLHELSIAKYGGTAGLRDEPGLLAAIHHPENVFYYGNGDLFDLAAAYAFHIAQAQSFLDGNKRTATAAALTFLEINGIIAQFDEATLYDLIIGFAEKRTTKSDLADYFRRIAKLSKSVFPGKPLQP